ncbi:unnamed protein product [Allacma fusca]|uniref:Uncharacterized protein n=1 Tax=Allacma fusca TaxID=39272 RepID=A0A8J2NJX3_9HEXA|nr:unnamed protein product [Allacma fusca]
MYVLVSFAQEKFSTVSNGLSEKINFATGLGTDSRLDIVLKFLKFFGSCPLSRNTHYSFKWTTSTLLSLCAALYFVFTYIVLVTHLTFKKFFIFGEGVRRTFTMLETAMKAESNPTKANSSMQALHLVILCLSTQAVISITLSWQSSFKLAEYLNNWNPIQNRFSSIFSSDDQNQQKHLGMLSFIPSASTRTLIQWFDVGLCCYVIVLGLFLTIIPAIAMSGSDQCSELWLILNFVVHNNMVEVLEDVKNVLIYRSLSDAFERTRSCIQQNLERGEPTELAVQSWRQILKQIQRQCKLAGRCLMPMQLAFLVNLLTGGTSCVFVCLNGFGSSRLSIAVSVMCGALFASWLSRLYFKILMAEKISEAELAIASDLVEMDSAGFSSPVLAQIRLTYDTLVQAPSRINFGNFVVLNKSLFLGV